MTEKEVEKLTLTLMAEHGLHWPTWGFRLTRHKIKLGRCMYNRYGGGQIEISKLWLHLPYEQIRDTILHEIAHALAGHRAKHGPEWKAVCRRIGAKPDEFADVRNEGKVEFKWTGLCINGHKIQRHALTEKGKRLACGKCCRELNNNVFDAKYLFDWHLTEDLRDSGIVGVRVINRPEAEAQLPTRISEMVAAGY
jgi:predicted SprT family Zn-dependent metalloprotease